MSTVNKASVRDEFDRIKAEFKQLRADKKMTAEVSLLVTSMFALMELILSIFLEKKTKKDNRNSSKPSSQTEKDDSAKTNTGSKAKGKKESKPTSSNFRINEGVTIIHVDFCNICGQDLSNTPCLHHERRTKIDIIFEKVITHEDAEIKKCPSCDSTVKGTFPEDMPGPLQYGNGIKAYIINLLVCQMVSLNRVQKLVKAMIGSVIAEASMLKFILRLYLALETWETSAIQQLLIERAINVDET